MRPRIFFRTGFQAQLLNSFVSYHHDSDQAYYDYFSRIYADHYDVIQDSSLDRIIDSDNPDYVMQRIRDKYISGTSCTIVLCGPETPWRKYVDWEIKATLDKEHGLIAINLPHGARDSTNRTLVPDRLHDNIVSGYAVWIHWNDLRDDPDVLNGYVQTANAKLKLLIINTRPMRGRDGP